MDNNNVTPDFTEPTPDVTPDYSSQDFSTPDYASEEASNPFSGTPETVTTSAETVSPVVETVETTIIEPEPIYQPTGDTTTNSTYSDTYTQTYDQSTYAVEGVDEKKNDGFSIASLVLGILSILCCCVPCLSFLPAVLAIVFGAISKKNRENKKSPLAIAGLILGIVGLILCIIMFIYGLVSGGMNSYSDYMNTYDSLY